MLLKTGNVFHQILSNPHELFLPVHPTDILLRLPIRWQRLLRILLLRTDWQDWIPLALHRHIPDNLDEIKSKKETLQETAMAFATKIYEEAAKANNEENNNENKDDKQDDAIDAEFEEK